MLFLRFGGASHCRSWWFPQPPDFGRSSL